MSKNLTQTLKFFPLPDTAKEMERPPTVWKWKHYTDIDLYNNKPFLQMLVR